MRWGLYLAAVAIAGCTDLPDEDGRDDAFLAGGKSDVFGVEEGSPEALGVLAVANTVAAETLLAAPPEGAGLATRAIDNLIYVRFGDDETPGTPDDHTIETLAELDAVPFIGPVAFRKLLDFARGHDFVKEPYVALALGGNHSCGWSTKEGSCWGGNAFGQLGTGSTDPALVPAPIKLGIAVRQLATGNGHSCALVDPSSARLVASSPVRCWGLNDHGQLGDASTIAQLLPISVDGVPNDIVQIATGASHTCARTTDGAVWCWGANASGQVGDGTRDDRLKPTAVRGLGSGAVDLILGGDRSCAVTDDAVLLCWGSNARGALGDGSAEDRLEPVRISGVSDVVSVAMGRDHTCANERDGATSCWGWNTFGQLGDGTREDKDTPTPVLGLPARVATVSLGLEHTCARLRNSTVACWGNNTAGRLGDGSTTDRLLPTPVKDLRDIVEVQTGYVHNCVRRSDDKVLCWGENPSGQLGDGTTSDRSVPTPLKP
jgi:alpha-tubulin suppressor-like RCC1 family protein